MYCCKCECLDIAAKAADTPDTKRAINSTISFPPKKNTNDQRTS